MSDWERALDKQLATYLWWDTPAARAIAQGWVSDTNAKYNEQDTVDRMIGQQKALMWNADPIFVTPEMGALLEAAWPTFELEPLREEDLIVRDGFALLPKVFPITDVWGKQMSIRAIGWRSGTIADDVLSHAPSGYKPGLLVSLYANPDDRDDYSKEWSVDMMRRLYGDAMSLVVTTPLGFAEDFEERVAHVLAKRIDREQIEEPLARAAMLSEIRLLQCFWRLTKQQIAVGFRQRPSRGTRRRSERQKYPDKYVTVVTLRRPKGTSSGDTHAVDWQSRWIVSGHWRWQPYGDGTRRQIWIAPYVKGPDDKPLAIRKLRVFTWSR